MATLRDKTKIKEDIEEEGEIMRQDVYELLVHEKDKDKKEKKKEVEKFLDTLPTEIKDKEKGGHTAKEKILDDLDSYPV